MKRNKKLAYAILSTFLLWFAWPPLSFTPLLFFALVPLLVIEDELFNSQDPKSSRRLFNYTFLTFLLWNILCTWWVWNASAVGMIIAVLLNAFLMSLPFFFYHKTRRYVGKITSQVAFICYWLSYEYFHLNWELSWPWMTLGNGFSEYTKWIQWYDYTGVFGGSLWVLSSNIIIYNLISKIKNKSVLANEEKSLYNSLLSHFFSCLLIIIAPISYSLVKYYTYQEKSNPSPIVIVQPNVDPYNEKFDGMTPEDQLKKIIHLSDSLGKTDTEFFIWPETSLVGSIYETDLLNNFLIKKIQSFLSKYKNGNVLTGANTYIEYNQPETPTARKYRSGECCYDAFNTALQIENSPRMQVYHKSKLVPGVERMPYPSLFRFLEPLAVNLGGTVGSLGTQNERTVFYTESGIGAAPVICYESVYGEYLSEYILKGAQFIAIITNDGWWGNTPGYKQHASYARLRAIETRRSIARSANTGISCFINQRGDIIQPTSWWIATAISGKINLNETITFYVLHGDFIAKIASVLTVIFILFIAIKRIKSKSSI